MMLLQRLAVLAASVAMLSGAAHAAVFNGTSGVDELQGGNEADILNGGDGNDTLNGGGGDDVLIGGLHVDSLQGGSGFDVVFVKALKRTLVASPDRWSVQSPDGTDTIFGDVEQVRFIDGSVFLQPLTAPMITADGFLLLPAWSSTSSAPVSIAVATTNGVITGITVTGGGASYDLAPPPQGRFDGIDLGSVTGTVSISGATFTAAAEPETPAFSNLGLLLFNDETTSVSINGSVQDRFKALFVTYDPPYVDGRPDEAKYFVNLQFVKLGVEYAEYLRNGGAPLIDFIVKTRNTRVQTLHDNLLGNINQAAMNSRASQSQYLRNASSPALSSLSAVLAEYITGTAAAAYVDRPYYDGVPLTAAASSSAQWDIVNGLARPTYVAPANTAFLGRDTDTVADQSIDTITSYSTVQAAITAAGANDTVALTSGTYAEALTLGKPLTIRAAGGAAAIIRPSSGQALTIQAGVGGGNVTLEGLYIEGGTMGVRVTSTANVGTLTMRQVSISRNSRYGLFLEGGTGGAATLVIRESAFADNGYQATGVAGPASIKLWGFTGNATFTNVMVTGERSGAERADYGIELTGVPNPPTNPTSPIGAVSFTNVTVDGVFEKNALAIYNYGNLDALAMSNVDLSEATTDWTYVFNIDGIAADVDAQQYDIRMPTGTVVQAAVQGDKTGQGAPGQSIVGTSSNDVITGKGGSDVLHGGEGDDRLYGHDHPGQPLTTDVGDDVLYGEQGNDFLDGGPGSDRLRGGEGNDRLYGGADTTVDYLFGGSGRDEALFVGRATDYSVQLESVSADVDGDGDNETVSAAKVTRQGNQATDYVYGVERLVFVDDISLYAFGSGVARDIVAPGIVVNETENFGYDTLSAAIAATAPGSVLRIVGTPNLTTEGVIQIVQDDLTVHGTAGTVVSGFQLGAGITTFTLDGDFAANVTGNSAANHISGNAAANVIDGGAGNDVIVGLGGNDRLVGGNGDDLIASTSGSDIVLGGAGNDRVLIATGGSTATVLGGSGADTFIVGAPDQNAPLTVNAVIADFVQGADKLNLGDLHKNGAVPTLATLALGVPATQATVQLDGFGIDDGTGTVAGSITLHLLDERVLGSGDFVFEDAQETWRSELGVAP